MVHFDLQAISLRRRALWGIALLASIGASASALAAKKPVPQLPADILDTCRKISALETPILTFKTDRSGRVTEYVDDDWNESKICPHHMGGFAAAGSYNNLDSGRASFLQQSRPPGVDSTDDPSQIGICRYGLKAARASFMAYLKEKDKFCKGIINNMQEIRSLTSDNKAQAARWKILRDLTKARSTDLNELELHVHGYLQNIANSLNEVANRYEADKKAISESLAQASTQGAAAAGPSGGTPASPCKDPVKPANGGPNLSCDDYMKLLGSESGRSFLEKLTGGGNGPLIQEERDVAAKLVNFIGSYRSALAALITKQNSLANEADAQIAQLDRSGTDDKSLLSNASGLTGAAGPAAGLLGRTSSGITGGGSALPAMASLAAAGASAAGVTGAGSKWGSSASSSTPGGKEAPAPGEKPADGTSPLEGIPFGGDLGNGQTNQNRGPASPLDPQPGTADPAKAVTEPGIFQPGSSAGSSSRAPGGKLTSTKSDGGAPVGSSDSGGMKKPEEMLGGFRTALDPKAAPKAPTNVQGEVASLLGQMKNLFNFDEGAPLDQGFGGAAPGAPGATGGEGGAPADSLAAADSGAGYGGEPNAGDAAAASTERVDAMQGSPLGSVDKSLFARVRYRHVRCMEKGLILYGLKERVE